MFKAFPQAYGLTVDKLVEPKLAQIKSVLGESHFAPKQYTLAERKHFNTYHKLFKLDSKPKSHIEALSTLSDAELKKSMPASLARLADFVIAKIEALKE
jgi:hypothetical protein